MIHLSSTSSDDLARDISGALSDDLDRDQSWGGRCRALPSDVHSCARINGVEVGVLEGLCARNT